MGGSKSLPGGPRPPSQWAVLVALFMLIVVTITILYRVPDPVLAIGLALVADFAVVEAVSRLFGYGSSKSSRLLLRIARKLVLFATSWTGAVGTGG